MNNGILLSLSPIFLIIFLGYFLKQTKLISEAFIYDLRRLVFYIFLPTLLFLKTSTGHIDNINNYSMVILGAIVPLLIIALISLLTLRQLKIIKHNNFTALLQGMITGNAVLIGLPIALVLFNKSEMTTYYIIITAGNLVINTLIIILLTKINSGKKVSIVKTLLEVIQNPILIAVFGGLLINITNIVSLPKSVTKALEMISQPTGVMGMILVGSSLELKDLFTNKREVILSSAVRLVLIPFMTYWICNLLDVSKSMTAVAILFNSVPVAVSSYVYEAELKGNPKLASKLIAFQTLASAFTIPFIIEYLVK